MILLFIKSGLWSPACPASPLQIIYLLSREGRPLEINGNSLAPGNFSHTGVWRYNVHVTDMLKIIPALLPKVKTTSPSVYSCPKELF
jgi:hypothetical protein